MDDAQGIQSLLDGLGEATLVKELVCDNEDALLVINLFELTESKRHAAPLEVDLLRYTKPKHILLPLCNRLVVKQVLWANIAGDGVAAPGAAAKG